MVLPHYLGRSKEIDIKLDEDRNVATTQNSFSPFSLLERIPLLLPQEAEQIFSIKENDDLKNRKFDKSVNPDQDAQPIGFADEVDVIDTEFENRTFERLEMFESSHEDDVLDSGIKQTGPQVSCHCQVSFFSSSLITTRNITFTDRETSTVKGLPTQLRW